MPATTTELMRKKPVGDEAQIVWLRPPGDYEYLREVIVYSPFRVRLGRKSMMGGNNTDGGQGSHTVAYATLKPSARSDWRFFERRLWWVKEYDRFKGRRPAKCGAYNDPRSAPCEAVKVWSIKAGCPSESWECGE